MQQQLSLFKSRMTEALAAELHCYNFAPVSCIVLQPCFLMEKKGMDLHSHTHELKHSIHKYHI